MSRDRSATQNVYWNDAEGARGATKASVMEQEKLPIKDSPDSSDGDTKSALRPLWYFTSMDH
jgi:hypothetical protein